MSCNTPGLPVHHQLPEFIQTHVLWVGDATQSSDPQSSPFPPTPNSSQHQRLSNASNFQCSGFFIEQLSNPYVTTGKTIALTRWTFAGKVMSLLLNMLSNLVITFLPRSKCLLISWLQSPSAVILEPQKNKVWHCFPIYFPWSDGTRCHDLHFLNVEL